MNRRLLLLGAVVAAAFQSFLLWQMIESRASILRDGVEVRLKTVPVEPRDLLRGKFVRLDYDVSTLPPELFPSEFDASTSRGTPVFVVLEEQQDGYWKVVRVYDDEDAVVSDAGQVIANAAVSGRVFIRGSAKRPIRLNYGIERFYVPEVDAEEIEDQYRDDNTPLDVIAAVGPNGGIQIKRLIIDGKTAYEEPLY